MITDSAGNTVVFGYSNQYDFNLGSDWMIVKYDPSGVLMWDRYMDGPASGHDSCQSVLALPSGGYVAVGTLIGLPENREIGIVMFSSLGEIAWQRMYQGPDGFDDVPMAAVLDGTSNTIITGYTERSFVSIDVVTLKYSPTGQRLWTRRYGTTRNEGANSLCVDSGDSPIVVGTQERSTSGYDFLTIKYQP